MTTISAWHEHIVEVKEYAFGTTDFTTVGLVIMLVCLFIYVFCKIKGW